MFTEMFNKVWAPLKLSKIAKLKKSWENEPELRQGHRLAAAVAQILSSLILFFKFYFLNYFGKYKESLFIVF